MDLFFSQGVVILCSRLPELGELRLHLERHGFEIGKIEETTNWPEMQGPLITIPWKLEHHADAWIDICDGQWPDDLNGELTNTRPPEEQKAQHAFALGAYGPWTQPGALQRALWRYRETPVAEVAGQHTTFIRIRLTYFLRSEEADTNPAPLANRANVERTEELRCLLNVILAFCDLPGVIGYFNPAGELLLALPQLKSLIDSATTGGHFPLEAVSSFRRYKIDDSWRLVDCVGMTQLGLADHEFAYCDPTVDRDGLTLFLVNVLLYQIQHKAIIAAGHTTDGPGGTLWRAEERERSRLLPLRKVIHWKLDGAPAEPESLRDNSPYSQTPASSASVPEAETDPAILRAMELLQPWLEQRQQMRARSVAWLRSPEFRTAFYSEAHLSAQTCQLRDTAGGGRETAALWEKIARLGIQSDDLWRQYQELADFGEVWLAAVVIVNPVLKTNPEKFCPCLLIASPDQSAGQVAMSGFISAKLGDIYTGERMAENNALNEMVRDDEFHLFRRRSLPVTGKRGFSAFLMDVKLKGAWLPPPDILIVPLLVLPGNHGASLQIPWSVATGAQTSLAPPKPSRPPPIPHAVPTKPKKKGGIVGLILKLIVGYMLLNLAFAVPRILRDLPSILRSSTAKPSKARQKESDAETFIVRPQSSGLVSRITPVSGREYQPLIGQDAMGSGFLFKTQEGLVLGATSRHQFGDRNMAPGRLFDLDDLDVTLDTKQVARQQESQFQAVTAVLRNATCLAYDNKDVLKNGDVLLLVLDKGKWIEGRLKAAKPHPLAQSVELMQMSVSTSENVGGMSGSPIVHAQTGRVVGVMQAADKAQGPTVIEFETICVILTRG